MDFEDGVPRFGTRPIETFIDSSREAAVALADVEGRAPELKGAVEADRGKQTTIEPAGRLSEDMFEGFTDAAQKSPFLRFDRRQKTNVVRSEAVPNEERPPDPRDVHESRSEFAQKQDERRDARVTTDPAKYAKDPNEFDFPGVDTGPAFRSVFGDNLSSDRFDTVEDRVKNDGVFNPREVFDIL